MAPNAKAQELVARQALRRARIDAATVEYVEAHATSTPLGDPTEVSAISAVYGRGQGGGIRAEPVAIGSVKPNVGHLEAGAGAVGFIKAVTAMNRATFPPQANLKTLNSKVDWASSGTRVVREASKWPEPAGGHGRRAAICSYGYGGTVSHAIVEQPEYTYNMASTGADLQRGDGHAGSTRRQKEGPVLLVLSAPQEKRLAPAANALAKWLLSPKAEKASLSAIANTLALRRAQHNYRATFVVESHEHAAQVLEAFAKGRQQEHESAISQGVVLGTGVSNGVVWVFSGHGAQWEKMGTELMRSSVEFREAVRALDPITRAESGFSATEALERGGFTDRSDRVQVMTYVVQVGLAAVLRSKGLAPSAIIGHSVGEIAASVAAGSLTPEEGALVVTRRAELYRSVQGQGAMFMVGKPFEQVHSDLEGKGSDVVAAIHSSPSSCVVSGKLDAVVAYAEELKKSGTKVMRVATDVAFHHRGLLSPLSGPLRDALQGGDGGIQPRPPMVPLYSTSDADPRATTLRDAEYWVRNMESPVLLTGAIRAAAADGFRLFLEVSSHPIVSHSIGETLLSCPGVEDEEETAVVGTMRRAKPAEASIMQAVGALHVKGADVDFRTVLGRRWSPDVPGTQWVHKSFWRKVESSGASGDDLLRATAGLVHDVNKHTLLGLRTPVGGTDNTVLYTTRLDKVTKPFPGEHPLHGTEIVPAAVLVNTFHHATGANTLSDITLRVPVAISAPRDIQVVVNDDKVKIASRLRQEQQQGGGDGAAGGSTQGRSEKQGDMSWVTHTTGHWNLSNTSCDDEEHMTSVDIESAKKRIGAVLPSSFSIDYLAKVGVSAMGFPWTITEHHGNLKEMLARVDADPSTLNDGKTALPWDMWSWAPLLDAATSVGSTIFFDDPKLRMPAHIVGVDFVNGDEPPPKTGWLYVQEATESNGGPAVHVSVCDDDGHVLVRFRSMRFSEIEGTPGVSGSVESLVHRLAWVPAPMSHRPAGWDKAVLLSEDEDVLGLYGSQLGPMLRIPDAASTISLQLSPQQGDVPQLRSICSDAGSNAAVIYCPGSVSSLADVPAQAEAFISKALALTKQVVNNASSSASAGSSKNTTKIFVVTRGVGSAASTPTALAHSPLHGLARIIASEHPDQWGALVDVEEGDTQLPALAIRYVHGQDVVRVEDQLPRVGRLQALPRELLYEHQRHHQHRQQPRDTRARGRNLLPRPEGTYLVTGGLGALGLEVAGWLVDKGARRIVLVSRRGLPPRSEWAAMLSQTNRNENGLLVTAVARMQAMEQAGATVWTLALDMSAPDAQSRLLSGLEVLAVPPVLGVVHAAGCVEDQLVMETTAESFARVLAPKVAGTLALDGAFPPGTLDWLVLFSSCGQLLGFPGQSSYASGNAFLDAMAARRRAAGDTAVAVQWTSWRGLGMAAITDFISAELEGKGVTDITVDEAFRAWEHLGRHDIDHGVVLRALPLDEGDPLPAAVLEHIAQRRTASTRISEPDGDAHGQAGGVAGGSAARPAGGPELKEWLVQQVREIIAGVLMLSGPDEVDPRAATADLGVDSVITVTLRRKLQAALKVKVPPTLTWSHPTANHLATWFMEKLSSESA